MLLSENVNIFCVASVVTPHLLIKCSANTHNLLIIRLINNQIVTTGH